MSPNHSFFRGQDGADGRPHDQRLQGDRSVGQDLDNIFRLTAAQPVAAKGHPAAQAPAERPRAPAGEGRRMTPGDLDAALDMLNRAAKAMDLMQSRFQHVEAYAKGVADRAEKDVAVAYAQAREWEVRVAGSETRLDELRDRADAAERRAEAAERRAEAAEAGAKEARDWLECFYDKIVTSFDARAILKSQAA